MYVSECVCECVCACSLNIIAHGVVFLRCAMCSQLQASMAGCTIYEVLNTGVCNYLKADHLISLFITNTWSLNSLLT